MRNKYKSFDPELLLTIFAYIFVLFAIILALAGCLAYLSDKNFWQVLTLINTFIIAISSVKGSRSE